ncbi:MULTISPECIES: DUF6221 family protein [unclassified Streptomyces]|uniref:DUF6221 family protein n=1 Tax=unclassified Streptomyces TaxID=2593676 RepID=UPI0033FB900B
MDDLVQFLRDRLDEDEALALEAPKGPWHIGNAVDPTQPCHVHTFPGVRLVADGLNWLVAEHIARHDPARVLREIEAKRQLLVIALAEPHLRCEEDNWYSCSALTDDHGELLCIDKTRAGKPCDCGRDRRLARHLHLLALPYADHADYRDEWRPSRSPRTPLRGLTVGPSRHTPALRTVAVPGPRDSPG